MNWNQVGTPRSELGESHRTPPLDHKLYGFGWTPGFKRLKRAAKTRVYVCHLKHGTGIAGGSETGREGGHSCGDARVADPHHPHVAVVAVGMPADRNVSM